MEEQDGAHGDALNLGPCEEAPTPGSRPSRVARSFYSVLIPPKLSKTSGAHSRSQTIPLSFPLCYQLPIHHRNREPHPKGMTDYLRKGMIGLPSDSAREILGQFQLQLCAPFR